MLRISFLRPAFLVLILLFGQLVLTGHSFAQTNGSKSDAPSVYGTVLTTMNSGGYTYIEVQTAAGKPWIAIPESNVKVGEEIGYYEGMVMQNFHSKTLDRTFAEIIFSPGLVQTPDVQKESAPQITSDDSFTAAVQAEQQQILPKPAAAMSGGSMGAIVPLDDSVTIEKATGENGYTVEELYGKSKELDGKTVQVRGKVVKFSPMIMGRNWVHIQDGTGNPMQNSHDLVVTTDVTVENNTVVTFEGTLAADKDFGAGYKYTVIVEEAKIVQ